MQNVVDISKPADQTANSTDSFDNVVTDAICVINDAIFVTDVSQIKVMSCTQKFKQLLKKGDVCIFIRSVNGDVVNEPQKVLRDNDLEEMCKPLNDGSQISKSAKEVPWYQRFNKKGKF